ncbi:MAG: DUF1592 domain-containing protein [Myxococcales bacterium]|nr:DUF1592 domain-containing protein [Myxococcales bacterium]
MRALTLMLIATVAAGGCDRQADVPAAPVATLQPAPAALPRLTRAQYENTVHDVLGADLTLPATLEPDVSFEHLLTVGSAVAKVSPRGVELYEEAARSLAAQIAGKPERLAKLLPCAPQGPADTKCLQEFVAAVGGKLWRRPLAAAERDAVVATATKAGAALGTFAQSAEYALVQLLQSSAFVYRIEHGEKDPAHPATRRLTAPELASRLAYFLWAGPPDTELLAAAANETLQDPKVRAIQIDRLLADPKARRSLRNFAGEWLQLHEVVKLNKDPKVYKHFSGDLGGSAREETLRLVEHLVFDTDSDFRQLLTTRTAFVDRRLAAIYEVPALQEIGHAPIELPDDAARRGLLGQVAFLGLAAHPVSSSPTLRGAFVRRFLLCDFVPDPPADLNTAIPEPSPTAKTLRQRLTAHMNVPGCSSCHKALDPIGFAFEHYDGIGRYRKLDNGEPIDTSGDLDGVAFADSSGFASVLANSSKFRRCVTKKLYAYAVARPTIVSEAGQIDSLAAGFAKSGMRVKGLLRQIALSEGFGRLAAEGK